MAYQSLNLPRNEVQKVNVQLETINEKMDELQSSVAATYNCTVEISGEEEKIDDRVTLLEEEVMSLKVQNIELRNHLNSAIRELNEVTHLLNSKRYDL